MKIAISSTKEINFPSELHFSRIIPAMSRGKVLNFGQGEGQIEIDSLVWGFYFSEEGGYCMALEEGGVSLERFVALVESIAVQIGKEIGSRVVISIKGGFS